MTKRKPKDQYLPLGRPTLYKPEYCDALVKHCREGGSFESFGAIVNVSKQTLYDWLDAQPDFLDARKRGETYLIAFYESLGKTMAAGQLRRIKSEEPLLDENGKPRIDPNTGKILMKYEYEPVTGNPTAWIFLTKNILNWRDKKDVALSDPSGAPLNFSGLSREELDKKINELVNKAKKKG